MFSTTQAIGTPRGDLGGKRIYPTEKSCGKVQRRADRPKPGRGGTSSRPARWYAALCGRGGLAPWRPRSRSQAFPPTPSDGGEQWTTGVSCKELHAPATIWMAVGFASSFFGDARAPEGAQGGQSEASGGLPLRAVREDAEYPGNARAGPELGPRPLDRGLPGVGLYELPEKGPASLRALGGPPPPRPADSGAFKR